MLVRFEPDACALCRRNCACACSSVTCEGCRGGSKLSKGRFSHGGGRVAAARLRVLPASAVVMDVLLGMGRESSLSMAEARGLLAETHPQEDSLPGCRWIEASRL